uniref:Hydrophobin n=1 Tax=Psilocybe cubensis TaxID=181762 RepID=A0A8H7Y4F7_PSICU
MVSADATGEPQCKPLCCDAVVPSARSNGNVGLNCTPVGIVECGFNGQVDACCTRVVPSEAFKGTGPSSFIAKSPAPGEIRHMTIKLGAASHAHGWDSNAWQRRASIAPCTSTTTFIVNTKSNIRTCLRALHRTRVGVIVSALPSVHSTTATLLPH